MDTLSDLLQEATEGERQIIYIDEAHIQLDTDEGYGWSVLGKRAWVSSSSVGLRKVSFFGADLYNQGQTRIYPYLTADTERSCDVLKKFKRNLALKRRLLFGMVPRIIKVIL